MRLADERRDQGQEQQGDQPGGVENQAGGKADHGDDVLRLAEQLPHQRHSSAGLPACPLELVLKFGVLEVFKVERRGVLHQPHAGGVGHALGQEAVDQRHDAPKNVRQHREREFGQQQHAEPVQHAAVEPQPQRFGPMRRLHQQHNIVDDQLADIQRDDRHDSANQPQHQRRRGQSGAGAPNHHQEGTQVL